MFEKDYRISYLLDYYGSILTEKQREAIDLYYNADLSLAEIADHVGITRQGVRDAIKRGEETLFEMEGKLGFAVKFEEYRKLFEEISEYAGTIRAAKASFNFLKVADETSVLITERLKSFTKDSE